MIATTPAGEEWLQKLEKWLADNRHPDIIYAVAIAHRDGYCSMLSNMTDENLVSDFLSQFMKETEKKPIYHSGKRQRQ